MSEPGSHHACMSVSSRKLVNEFSLPPQSTLYYASLLAPNQGDDGFQDYFLFVESFSFFFVCYVLTDSARRGLAYMFN